MFKSLNKTKSLPKNLYINPNKFVSTNFDCTKIIFKENSVKFKKQLIQTVLDNDIQIKKDTHFIEYDNDKEMNVYLYPDTLRNKIKEEGYLWEESNESSNDCEKELDKQELLDLNNPMDKTNLFKSTHIIKKDHVSAVMDVNVVDENKIYKGTIKIPFYVCKGHFGLGYNYVNAHTHKQYLCFTTRVYIGAREFFEGLFEAVTFLFALIFLICLFVLTNIKFVHLI